MNHLGKSLSLAKLLAAGLILSFAWTAPASANAPHCETLKKCIVKIEVQGRDLKVDDKGLHLEPFTAIGAGVLLDRNRHVLTAAHVIGLATTITVTGPAGGSTRAHPIAQDRTADIAVLELDENLPSMVPARLSSSLPQPGDELWTLGHPIALDYSLSRGIVSAVRPMSAVGAVGWKGHVLQTDAAINPGVSGGGLFDTEGRLVGIAVSIVSRSGGFEGIGFGIALDAVKDVLQASPCVWLGMDAAGVEVGGDLARALGAPGPAGFLVQQVFPDSPASAAGLRAGTIPALVGDSALLLGGDLILKINGYEECRSACRLLRVAPGQDMPQTVTVEVWRGGKSETVLVKVTGSHTDWGPLFAEVQDGDR